MGRQGTWAAIQSHHSEDRAAHHDPRELSGTLGSGLVKGIDPIPSPRNSSATSVPTFPPSAKVYVVTIETLRERTVLASRMPNSMSDSKSKCGTAEADTASYNLNASSGRCNRVSRIRAAPSCAIRPCRLGRIGGGKFFVLAQCEFEVAAFFWDAAKRKPDSGRHLATAHD